MLTKVITVLFPEETVVAVPLETGSSHRGLATKDNIGLKTASF